MGSVGDFFMGSTTSPSVSTQTTMTDEQRQLLDSLSGILQGQLGQGTPAYTGNLTAPQTDLETQSWSSLSDMLSNMGGSTNTDSVIQQLLNSDTSTPNIGVQQYDVGEFDPTAIKEWYQNALVQPAMQAWQEDVVPTINESFIGQNAASSGAAPRAITKSAEDLMSGLNSEYANALFGEKQAYDTRKYESGMDFVNKLFQADTAEAGMDYQSGQNYLDRLMNIPGLESTETSNLLNIINAGQTAGETQRGIEQGQMTEDYQKWLSEQAYNNPWLTQFMSSVMGTPAFENIVYPGSQSEGILNSILGAVGSWAGSEGGSNTIAGWFS